MKTKINKEPYQMTIKGRFATY